MLRYLALALAATASPAPAAEAGPFDWLAGRWCTAEEKGMRTCESWTGWRQDRMEGESVTTRDGKVIERERLLIRLERGKAAYDASPAGKPATTFTEASRSTLSLSFENRSHDYPQRIRYWRDGEALLAEISLADGSRAIQWRYRPCRDLMLSALAPPR